MADFSIYILGCGSALPTRKHLPACQVVRVRGRLLMIDCGEGAQLQMRQLKLNFNRLTDIFITHLHGDHCFGLPGLISSMGLLGRTRPLRIYGPYGLKDFLEPLLAQFCAENPYLVDIRTHATEMSTLLLDDHTVSVRTIPLHHRIPCAGFVIEEKQASKHLIKDNAQCSLYAQKAIVCGIDQTTKKSEEIVGSSNLHTQAKPPKRYAYCSDTAFEPRIIPYIIGADLLYHEATFGSELQERATHTMHSTAAQAATIASMAGVKKLLIGHYSSRYKSEDGLLGEAQSVFSNTHLANEGMIIDL